MVNTEMILARRVSLPKALQVAVFRRYGWLCYWCEKPVIFAPVLKYLEIELRKSGSSERLSYYNKNWRRADAPLLDLLGAEIDHIDGNKANNDPKNLATSCHKCNLRKGDVKRDKWNEVPANTGRVRNSWRKICVL
jgi:HNH endonuclease